MTLFLLCSSILFLLAALHPFATYPLSLLWLRSRRVRHEQKPLDAAPCSFAICMCAYNEEKVIEAKIQNLLALRTREPSLQILVYVDAASDGTAAILQRYASEIELHVSQERHGKTHGMNLLSARATADVLMFTDANVMLDLDCLDELRGHFAATDVGCVCGNLLYTNGDASVTANSGSLYWRFEQGLKLLETELGSSMGADGSIFAIRRHLRQPPPDHIIDDMYVSLMTLCLGFRVVQVRDVRGYEESVTASAEEFQRKVRIACQAFNVHRLLWPKLRTLDAFTRYQYVSHKLMRWLSIYFLAASAVTFIAMLWSAGLPQIALGLLLLSFLVVVWGQLCAIKPILQALDVLTALYGAGLGVWRSLAGQQYQTWTPAASIRQGR
jgi:cellulose synthase/poly-beta-1,6-N-acetylglucosamine synthase-like glycosyltransferase